MGQCIVAYERGDCRTKDQEGICKGDRNCSGLNMER